MRGYLFGAFYMFVNPFSSYPYIIKIGIMLFIKFMKIGNGYICNFLYLLMVAYVIMAENLIDKRDRSNNRLVNETQLSRVFN